MEALQAQGIVTLHVGGDSCWPQRLQRWKFLIYGALIAALVGLPVFFVMLANKYSMPFTTGMGIASATVTIVGYVFELIPKAVKAWKQRFSSA